MVMAAYYRTVRTTAKGRWYGRQLCDVLPELGPGARVRSDLQHIVRPHDTIEYDLHVHEPAVPVVGREAVLHATAEFIVVNKPSGIPVHPTVNYYYNSVTEQLRAAYGPLFPCYRLDRATSGVLVLARTPEFASRIHGLAVKHKKYYARTQARHIAAGFDAAVFTDPIVTYNAKRGYAQFVEAWRQAKPATTNVRLAARCGEFAVLECTPVTGRTHQIRKHLALHGMPIDNDDVYADAALYQRLCRDATEKSFAETWDRSEALRREKLTGAVCSECGTPLYESAVQPLFLHCAEYGFDGQVFQAPVDWLPEELRGPVSRSVPVVNERRAS